MEGFAVIHSRFSHSTVWLVLDGQHLTYYDKLDLSAQQPKGLRGSLNVRDAIVVKLDREVLRNGIKVRSQKGKLTFACPDEQAWGYWFVAIGKAAVLHMKESEQQQKLARLKSLLEITPEMTMSKALISRAYKKLSLKAHPDKGGDPTVFHEIREAYGTLLAMQVDIDDLANSDLVHYEATIEKKPGVGLGISVTEDPIRRQLLVSSVHANTKINFLSEESMGEIRMGDALIGIDVDDCTRWPLLRVKARLDNNRVPLYHTVVLTFERRVPKDDSIAPPSPLPAGASFFFRREEREDSPEPFSSPSNEEPHRGMRDETKASPSCSPAAPDASSPADSAETAEESPGLDAFSPITPAHAAFPASPPEPAASFIHQLFPAAPHSEEKPLEDEEQVVDQPPSPPSPPIPAAFTSRQSLDIDADGEHDQTGAEDHGRLTLSARHWGGEEQGVEDAQVQGAVSHVHIEQLERSQRMNEILTTQVDQLTAELQALQASYLSQSLQWEKASLQLTSLQAQAEAYQSVLDQDNLTAAVSVQMAREYALLCQEKLRRVTTEEMTRQLHREDFCRSLFSVEAEEVYRRREKKAAEIDQALKQLIA